MEILDINTKWPGSHNDSSILNLSSIADRFIRKEFGDSWLLGDSGYGLKDWLTTPYLDSSTPEEKMFNISHEKTRGIIEITIGCLKVDLEYLTIQEDIYDIYQIKYQNVFLHVLC